MANKAYGAISHIGGADGDLDAIAESVLTDGDIGFVVDATNNTVDVYTLDASNATAEDAVNFTCIVPDDEAATPGKRWIRVPTVRLITDIPSAIKSGSDATLVTGTEGDANDFIMWNGDGDAVGSGLAATEIGRLAVAAEWTAQQNFDEQSITSSGNSVAWDWDTKQVAVHTLTENTTIAAPSNANAGSVGYLRVVQAAGLYTLAWNATFEWGAQATPSEPAASGDEVLFGFYYDGSEFKAVELCRVEA